MESNSDQPKILLAEADAAQRANLERLFLRSGWQCDSVENIPNSLNALEQGNYDLLVADLLVPGEALFNYIKTIKQNKPEQAMIVVASSYSADEAIELLRQGVNDCLQKPIDLDSLERAVKRVLALRSEEKISDQIFRYVTKELVSYSFSSAELARLKMPVWLAHRLNACGKIDLSTKLKLQLAFDEALTNSLEHGNLELQSSWKEEFNADGLDKYSTTKRERLADPKYAEKRIFLEFEYSADTLSIKIKDQGKGFLPEATSKFERGDEELLTHGRGVGLIYSLMDEVTYSAHGRELKMIKRLN